MAGKKVRVEYKRDAMYKLRSEPGVRKDLERRAKSVLDAAGGEDAGYGMSSQQGERKPQGRWRASVFTKTAKGRRDNARNSTLIKSLDAGRG
jgi:hypothetical protein